MALLEKQLFVKKSTIPNSGKGLFTKKFIPKGTRIIEYKGKVSTWKEVEDEDGKNGYIFFVNRNHVINALTTKKSLARYANDAKGLVRVKGLLNNCDYITDGKKAYIESKKDIEAGGEIFVDYGNDYWKVIRENIRLWAREAKEKEKELEAKRKAKLKKQEAKAKNGKVSTKATTKKSGAKKVKAKKSVRKRSKV